MISELLLSTYAAFSPTWGAATRLPKRNGRSHLSNGISTMRE